MTAALWILVGIAALVLSGLAYLAWHIRRTPTLSDDGDHDWCGEWPNEPSTSNHPHVPHLARRR